MNLCYELGVRLYKCKNKNFQTNTGSRGDNSEKYWEWQFETSGNLFKKNWDLDSQIREKRILDIGCGLGGRSCYLITRGAVEVVGLEINSAELAEAGRLADKKLDSGDRKNIKFIGIKENERPAIGAFDIVLLIDVLEHVKSPVDTLNFAFDMLKPGGVCYFSTVGWYHYNASHLMDILPIPFATLFFSDRVIIDAVRKIVSDPAYIPTMWDSDPPGARWEGIKDLRDRPGEYLNKITIGNLKKIINESKFCSGKLRVEGFSWTRAQILRCLNFLAQIPLIQEVYHSGCFGRLTAKERDRC